MATRSKCLYFLCRVIHKISTIIFTVNSIVIIYDPFFYSKFPITSIFSIIDIISFVSLIISGLCYLNTLQQEKLRKKIKAYSFYKYLLVGKICFCAFAYYHIKFLLFKCNLENPGYSSNKLPVDFNLANFEEFIKSKDRYELVSKLQLFLIFCMISLSYFLKYFRESAMKRKMSLGKNKNIIRSLNQP